MADGKHSLNANHSQYEGNGKRKQSKSINRNNHFKKNLFFLIILVSLIILVYIQFFSRNNETNKDESVFTNKFTYENSVSYSISKDGKSSKNVIVDGAEYLEMVKFNIDSNDTLSTVSTKFQNNSNTPHENIELRVTFYDSNSKEITSLDYKIDKINANGNIIAHGTVKEDLSNCVTCSVALRKK